MIKCTLIWLKAALISLYGKPSVKRYSSDADFVMTLRVMMTQRRFKIITTIPDFFNRVS